MFPGLISRWIMPLSWRRRMERVSYWIMRNLLQWMLFVRIYFRVIRSFYIIIVVFYGWGWGWDDGYVGVGGRVGYFSG